MNYLAHAYLSGDNEQLLIGNVIGDFVKGDPQKLALPPQITKGIRLHRKIDAYYEAHASLRAAKAYLPEQQKRYASIILDILNDHFLAKKWSKYHVLPLKTFTMNTYRSIDKYLDILPPDFNYIYEFIKRDDWLAGYADKDNTIYAINRMSFRFRDPEPLQKALNELLINYEQLENQFHSLFADLQQHLNFINK